MNKPLLLAASCLITGAAAAQNAELQVIHNCADLAAAEVDVYVNGTLALDDFAFRTATPFLTLPAGVPLNIGIAPSTSTSVVDVIAPFTVTLADGEKYIAVASGIVSPTGYNPAPAFNLEIFPQARTAASGGSGNTDVLVFHGSTDAPTVDVFESAVVETTIVDDLSYADFAGYLELPTLDFTIQVRTADNSTIVAAYAAPLQTLGLGGAALAVVASGFLDPSVNSGGPAFGLYVALPAGGALIPLPSASIPSARLQVIHNSADLVAAEVDVYINGALAIDDFAFRTATPFLDFQAGVPINIGIAPGNSTSAGDIIAPFTFTLADGEKYVAVANGIVSPTGYNPIRPFDIYVTNGAEEDAPAGTTNVLVFHGCTDAPVVDVAELAVLGGATVVDDMDYGDFVGYLNVPTVDLTLQVQLSDGTPVVTYDAPLATLGLDGAALVVVASGFLDPSVNSNGEAFGLWVALTSGGNLIPLPLSTSVREPNSAISGLTAWPNPAQDQLMVEFNAAEENATDLMITDALGRVVREVALGRTALGLNRRTVDVNDLAPGSYRLSLRSTTGLTGLGIQVVR
ncbi:MAG: DUF4397 domain-containing protein [Flavobacteriales bacterium]|nr:DUF4397 domain-containing protein [Flavobacteriales bacterium]